MWIKICGIRDIESALAAAQAGADAIGLNFYAESPRVVAPAVAAEIVATLDGAAEPVGVFVNHSVEEIRAICRQCGLRTIQLHGDEPAEQVAELVQDYRVIRAFRVGAEGMQFAGQYLDECQRLNAMPWACLVDARVPGRFGGTGHTAPWSDLALEYKREEWRRFILAGGLRPENVSHAIAIASPWGVDVAGGVESSVACKDIALVRQFVLNARQE